MFSLFVLCSACDTTLLLSHPHFSPKQLQRFELKQKNALQTLAKILLLGFVLRYRFNVLQVLFFEIFRILRGWHEFAQFFSADFSS